MRQLLVLCLLPALAYAVSDFAFSITPPNGGYRYNSRIVLYTGVPLRTFSADIYVNSSCAAGGTGLGIPSPELHSYSYGIDASTDTPTDLFLAPSYDTNRYGLASYDDGTVCMNLPVFMNATYRYASITIPPVFLGQVLFSNTQPLFNWLASFMAPSEIQWHNCDPLTAIDPSTNLLCSYKNISIDPMLPRTCESTRSVWAELGLVGVSERIQYPSQIPTSAVVTCPANITQFLSPSNFEYGMIYDAELRRFSFVKMLTFWDQSGLYNAAALFVYICVCFYLEDSRIRWYARYKGKRVQSQIRLVSELGWKGLCVFASLTVSLMLTFVFVLTNLEFTAGTIRSLTDPTFPFNYQMLTAISLFPLTVAAVMWANTVYMIGRSFKHRTLPISVEISQTSMVHTVFILLAVVRGPYLSSQTEAFFGTLVLFMHCVSEWIYWRAETRDAANILLESLHHMIFTKAGKERRCYEECGRDLFLAVTNEHTIEKVRTVAHTGMYTLAVSTIVSGFFEVVVLYPLFVSVLPGYLMKLDIVLFVYFHVVIIVLLKKLLV